MKLFCSSVHILDYLCNMKGLQLRSQDTSKDKDTKKSQEDWEERAMICKTTAPEIDSQPVGLPNCTDISEVCMAVCYSVSAALILSRSELFLKINFTLSSNSNSFYFKGFGAEANYLVVKPQTKWVRTPQVGWSIMQKSIFLVLYSIVYIIGFLISGAITSHDEYKQAERQITAKLSLKSLVLSSKVNWSLKALWSLRVCLL